MKTWPLTVDLDREEVETPVRVLDTARIAEMRAAKFAAFQELATSDETPIRPERVVATLARHLPENAVVVADPGTPCPYLSAFLRLDRAGRSFICNRAHGALGYSLPAVVGVKVGRPEAKCVAVIGDGSFGFACGEMESIQRLGLPITLIVISNTAFGWIKAGQQSGFDPHDFSVDFTPGRHAAIVRLRHRGLRGGRARRPRSRHAKGALGRSPDPPGHPCQPLHEANAPVSEWIA